LKIYEEKNDLNCRKTNSGCKKTESNAIRNTRRCSGTPTFAAGYLGQMH
jgi:hypothetical protein